MNNIETESGKTVSPMKEDEISEIFVSNSQILTEMVKGALENEGIPVLLKSAAGYHSRGMLPFGLGLFDYKLLVGADDEVRAREIVEAIAPPEEIK